MKLAKIEELRACKTDKERWRWLLDNKDSGLIVMLDNDDTFVSDPDDEGADVVQFDWYIGWSQGVIDLLDVLGIKAEEV